MQRNVVRLVAPLAALALVGAACTGDDTADEPDEVPDEVTDETPPDVTEDVVDETDPPDETEPPDETDPPDVTDPDDVTEVQVGESLLDVVQERGHLNCGVNETLPGFGAVDPAGDAVGFDVDFCRVVAAAVLGDADAVEYVSATAENRFTLLQAGEIDLLSRNTTWTATRDGDEGLTFLFTTFYDGQGMMVPADTDFTELEDLADANICVLAGTTTELNLDAEMTDRGIPYNPLPFPDNDALQPAYMEGQCEAWTADGSALVAFKTVIEDEEGGPEQHIFVETFSKEPLGPAVLDGDSAWAQAVEWSIMATVQAWEFGLTSENIGDYDGDDGSILDFLGDAGDLGLGLDPEFNVNIIEQVGNYQEIFERHLIPLGLVMEGTPNNLWTEGGLLYAPPYR